VPAGWNKPANGRGRHSWCEVVKTWDREATVVENRLTRRIMVALKGAETQGGAGPQTRYAWVETLKLAEAEKRMGMEAEKPLFGGCVEGLEDVETFEAWRNQCAS